ncbi:MAG TPA: ABC transporter permease [Atribacteraceae bacterium]|nr:ABC transporter permease [Atribacteraceae bacterium]
MASKQNLKNKWSTTLILFLILLVMVVTFSVLSRDFISHFNIISMLTNISFIGIIAGTLTFVMITGGLDISVGGNIALVSCVVAALYNMPEPLPMWLITLIGLGVGACIGSLNGLLITRLNLSPIITTLGTMAMAQGGAFVISRGLSILVFEDFIGFIGRGSVLGLPTPLFLFGVIYVVLGIVLARSKLGRKVYCIGANQEAARLSGIQVERVKFGLYLMSGLAASFSGLILVGQTAVGMPQHGIGTELDIISAVLLGGTALSGGKGSILGTLAGALILGVLYNGFTMIGFKWVHIRIFQGILLIAIVAIYELRERKRY